MLPNKGFPWAPMGYIHNKYGPLFTTGEWPRGPLKSILAGALASEVTAVNH